MKFLTKQLFLIALLLIFGLANANATSLYFSLDSTPDGLYLLDTTNGAATSVGISGVESSTVGLSPSGDDTKLFGTSWQDLLSVNADGSGYTNLGGPGAEGLAYNHNTSTLYGAINGNFFTMDTSTGANTGYLTSPGADVEGLAYGGGDTIYGLVGYSGPRGYLYSYDIILNSWTFIGDTGVDFNLPGLAYNPELDLLYAKGSQDGYLYSINPNTAAISVIGDTGLTGGGGLAFVSDSAPIPEPSTMLLLGCGLFSLAGVTRRKFKK